MAAEFKINLHKILSLFVSLSIDTDVQSRHVQPWTQPSCLRVWQS
jgi:hypothetical protein